MRIFWSRGSSSSEGWNGQRELEGRPCPRSPGVLGHRRALTKAGRNRGGQCVRGTSSLPVCSRASGAQGAGGHKLRLRSGLAWDPLPQGAPWVAGPEAPLPIDAERICWPCHLLVPSHSTSDRPCCHCGPGRQWSRPGGCGDLVFVGGVGTIGYLGEHSGREEGRRQAR